MIREYPTIQEAFDEILSKKRQSMTLDDAFLAACEEFADIYKIKPPYSSSDSYRVASSKKVRVRKL